MDMRPTNPHAFEFSAQFRDDHDKFKCKSLQLQKILGAFVRNMSRVRGIGMLPINVVAISVLNEAMRMEALANLRIPFRDPTITVGDPHFDQSLFDKVDTERQRLVNEWAANRNTDKSLFKTGSHHFNLIIDINRYGSWEGVQATLAAMVMGLWTAFESLVQDTWIAAVNAHRKPLADRVLKTLDKDEQQKFLSGKVISEMDYDLRNCMGDILLRKRVVAFQQLRTIRDAYKVAFADEFEPIFSSHYDALSELEAVRNLFAHRGGVIDERFKSKVKEPTDMEAGNIYCVTGHYVAQQADIVSVCSTELIGGVDDWLERNQSTSV